MSLYGTSKINASGHLEIGGIDTVDLVNQYGTPLYVLDEQEIRNRMRQYINAFAAHGLPFQVAYSTIWRVCLQDYIFICPSPDCALRKGSACGSICAAHGSCTATCLTHNLYIFKC